MGSFEQVDIVEPVTRGLDHWTRWTHRTVVHGQQSHIDALASTWTGRISRNSLPAGGEPQAYFHSRKVQSDRAGSTASHQGTHP